MSKVKIKPLGTRVLVEPTQAEQKTVGGIIIPDSAQEKPQQGKVVAVGKEVRVIQWKLKLEIKLCMVSLLVQNLTSKR